MTTQQYLNPSVPLPRTYIGFGTTNEWGNDYEEYEDDADDEDFTSCPNGVCAVTYFPEDDLDELDEF